MVSLACSKMKPMTAQQLGVATTYRINTTEKNAIYIALWYERFRAHQIAARVIYADFGNRGDTNGRT